MARHTRDAWLIFTYYFLQIGAIGCTSPYAPLYYQHIGLSGEQIGLLTALGSVVVLLSGPLWGAMGDRFNLHRRLLPIATGGTIIPALLIPIIGATVSSPLPFFIVLILIQAFFATAIGPLADSAALEIATKAQTGYGHLRIGGTIGFIFLSVTAGWLLTKVDLTWIFYLYALCMSVAVFSALPLPARQHHWQAPLREGFTQLLKQRTLPIFLIATFLIGGASTMAGYFYPLHIQFIGGDSNMIGLTGAVGAISEIPILFLARSVIKRVGGAWRGVVIGATVYALRWLLLSYTTSITPIVIIQMMHSISFGIFLVSSIEYVESQAPKGLSTTAQSLFIAATWGLGPTAGSLVGGVLYANFGTPTLFRVASAASLIAVIILFAVRKMEKTHAAKSLS